MLAPPHSTEEIGQAPKLDALHSTNVSLMPMSVATHMYSPELVHNSTNNLHGATAAAATHNERTQEG